MFLKQFARNWSFKKFQFDFWKFLSFILRTDFLFEIFLAIKTDRQSYWYYFGEKYWVRKTFFFSLSIWHNENFLSNLHCKLKTKDRKSPLILAYLYFIESIYLVIIYFQPVFIFFMFPKETDYEKKVMSYYYYIYCLSSCSMYSL